MARPALLTAAEIESALAERPHWELHEDRLHRELRFGDFAEAFAFMTRVALAAEKLDHHPDWSNSWNRVVIDITSHDVGGLTAQCLELADAVDRAVG